VKVKLNHDGNCWKCKTFLMDSDFLLSFNDWIESFFIEWNIFLELINSLSVINSKLLFIIFISFMLMFSFLLFKQMSAASHYFHISLCCFGLLQMMEDNFVLLFQPQFSRDCVFTITHIWSTILACIVLLIIWICLCVCETKSSCDYSWHFARFLWKKTAASEVSTSLRLKLW